MQAQTSRDYTWFVCPLLRGLHKNGMRVGKACDPPAEFRKAASSELNHDIGTLLKAYQEEVDRLTSRCTPTALGFTNIWMHASPYDFRQCIACLSMINCNAPRSSSAHSVSYMRLFPAAELSVRESDGVLL